MSLPAQARAGHVVGDYEILCTLGKGGMGQVCKAFDVNLRRTVALKFLSPCTSIGTAEHDSILREARAAAALDHENIATVYAAEHTNDGQLFIVMAYYEGESLACRLEAGPLTQSEALHIILQVARGLAHAHAHGIIHGDIKPSNVMLTPDGLVKIVDFGLARFASADATTDTLSLAGTLPYMAPEQFSGKAVDARSDIWSLGVLMYQLLVHKLPFDEKTTAATIAAILNSRPAEMGDVPLLVQQATYRALSKNAAYRYQTCAELVHDLEDVLTPDDNQAVVTADDHDFQRYLRFASSCLPARSPWLRRHASRIAIIAAVMVLALIYSLVPWRSLRAPPRQTATASHPAAHQRYLQGVAYLDRFDKPGNLDAAVRSFQAVTDQDPNFALAYAALAEAYWDKYRLDENPQWLDLASAACNKAAALNEQLPSIYWMLGRIHDSTGQYDLALQEVERALALDAGNREALFTLAAVYAHVGRVTEAEENYKKAIALRPDDWKGHYRLGSFYYSQERFEDGAGEFRRVIELAPDHAEAHASLALMQMSLGDDAAAEQEFRQSIALAPGYAAYTNLGQLYYSHKRYTEAAEMTEKALGLNDKDYRVWYDSGLTYQWLGQESKARGAFRRAQVLLENIVRVQERDPRAHATLGILYAQQLLRTKALAQLEAALTIAPQNGEVQGKVGEAYEYLGEHTLAVRHVQQARRKGWKWKDVEASPALRHLLSEPNARQSLEQVQ